MNRPSLFRPIALAVIGFSVIASSPAQAENPLEQLRRHIHSQLFGRNDHDDDRHDKYQRKDYRRDDDRERHEDRVRHGYYNSRPSYGYSAPSVELRYDNRYDTPPVRSSRQELSLGAEVQIALQRRGYYRGAIDGAIGPESRAAIRHFQLDQDLAPTGRIDRELLSSLEI